MTEERKSKVLLEAIAKSLVSNEDKVVVSEKTDEMGILLSLSVAKEDVGKVIGKNGVTANAIRTIIRGVGATENARVSVKIDDTQ